MVTWIRYSTRGGDPKDVRCHPSNPDIVYGCSAHGSVLGFSITTRKVRKRWLLVLAYYTMSHTWVVGTDLSLNIYLKICIVRVVYSCFSCEAP